MFSPFLQRVVGIEAALPTLVHYVWYRFRKRFDKPAKIGEGMNNRAHVCRLQARRQPSCCECARMRALLFEREFARQVFRDVENRFRTQDPSNGVIA